MFVAFKNTKSFTVPLNLLFEAWVKPTHLQRWLAPSGFGIRFLENDLSDGNTLRYLVEGSSNAGTYACMHFESIHTEKEIVYQQFFTQENGEIIQNPMGDDWPKQTRTEIKFTGTRAGSELSLTHRAYEATETQEQVFSENMHRVREGWSGALKRLENYLNDLLE